MNILLIDGNSLGYTSHHAGALTELPSGLQTQAIDGFVRAVSFKLMETALLPVVIWDGRAQWRYDLHPGYKSGRTRTEKQIADRANYNAQVPYLQKLLKHLGVLQLRAPAAEADDLAYQIVRVLDGTGHLVELTSSDTDWWQFLSPDVSWRGCRKTAPYVSFENFTEISGYATPQAFIEGKALKGDGADDIEGIEGIGEKTAISVMAQLGSRDNLQTKLKAGELKLAPKIVDALVAHEQLWERNLQLMDLSLAPKIAFQDLQVLQGFTNLEGLVRIAAPLNLTHVLRWQNELVSRFSIQYEKQAEFLELIKNL